MNNIDKHLQSLSMMRAEPVLRIIWLIVLLAIRDKCKVVSFSCRRGKKNMTVKLDYKYKMVPPPRYLFYRIVNTLRRAGIYFTKDPKSPFEFDYTETKKERTLNWHINYDTGCDLVEKVNTLLRKLDDEGEAKRQLEDYKEQQRLRRKRWNIAIAFIISLAAFIGLLLLRL